MAREARRESMMALKATHTAVRVARNVEYPNIEMTHVECPDCEVAVDWVHANERYEVICPSCGETFSVPCHLRPHVERPTGMRMGPAPENAFGIPPIEKEDFSSPAWVKQIALGLLLMTVTGLLGAIILIACKLI